MLEKGQVLERVVDYCPEVSSVWRGLCSSVGQAAEEDATKQFKNAKKYFLTLLGEAETVGIAKEQLQAIILKRLPTGLLKDLAE